MAAAAAAGLAVSVDFSGARSPRKQIVTQLLAAARTGNEDAMRPLLMPRAVLIGESSFDATSTSALYLGESLRDCSVAAMSEALGVVAADLVCRGGEPGGFVLHFAFCGQRVIAITHDERGHWLLSPMGRELKQRFERWLGIENPLIPTCRH
jgi:hypothetical protein